jgi:signal transduction histidine kinase
LRGKELTPEEQQFLEDQDIVLWCSIRHSQGYLLGVLLLGMRGDLDPYRSEDLLDLQRLIDAASLAFTNSAAYTQQRESEATIRQLYQRLQEAHDTTASEIARDLHDEVMHIPALNIEGLRRLASYVTDPAHGAEIDLLLQGEYTVITLLRTICAQLRPPGIDEPFGLPRVLRDQAQLVEMRWSGTCEVRVVGTHQPLSLHTQWEAFRITREALNNAVKHAGATHVRIELQYPEQPEGVVHLAITDNGCSGQQVQVKPGHWGMLDMQESARSVGGQLQIQRRGNGSHSIIFTFSAERPTKCGIIDEGATSSTHGA